MLKALFLLPQARGSFNFSNGTLSYPQIPAAYFLCDVHMHSTSRDVWLSLWYRQREYHHCHGQGSLNTAHLLKLIYFLCHSLYSLQCLQSVFNMSQSKHTVGASPEILVNLIFFNFLDIFSDVLSTLKTLMTIWKRSFSVLHTHMWTFSGAIHKFS